MPETQRSQFSRTLQSFLVLDCDTQMGEGLCVRYNQVYVYRCAMCTFSKARHPNDRSLTIHSSSNPCWTGLTSSMVRLHTKHSHVFC